jgi:hypothetical protein
MLQHPPDNTFTGGYVSGQADDVFPGPLAQDLSSKEINEVGLILAVGVTNVKGIADKKPGFEMKPGCWNLLQVTALESGTAWRLKSPSEPA